MHSLSTHEVIEVCEAGRLQHPIDRALTLLAAAGPELSRDALADLCLGERDARLLALHESMFGAELLGCTECAACGERLELRVPVADLRRTMSRRTSTTKASEDGRLVCDGIELRLRPVTSRDLAAAASAVDAQSGRRLLAERCALDTLHQDARTDFAAFPEATADRLTDAVSKRLPRLDPGAEILLDAECPACGQRARTLLDAGVFVWNEVLALARRLLREIHVLARAYHWSESEILSITEFRRRTYLDMVCA